MYRKARVLEEKGRADEAMGLLRRVTRLYPENKSAKNDLQRLQVKQRKSRQQEFAMSKRMLGLDKVKPKEKPFFGGGSKMALAAFAVVGAVGALLGAAFYKLNDVH